MEENETTSVSIDKEYLGSIALGMATGLVLGDRMSRGGREVTSFILLGAGLVATVPFLTKYVQSRINSPSTDRGSQRRLESIRSAGSYEYSEEDEVSQAS